MSARPVLLVAALVAIPAPALAAQIHANDVRPAYARASLENDFLAFRVPGVVTDHDYTSGLLVEWMTERGWRLTVGQKLYTPRIVRIEEPLPTQRPYAGWLYGEIGHLTFRPGHLRDLGLALGVIGPEALGEPVQNGFHAIAFSGLEPGWHQQLREGLVYKASAAFAQPPHRQPTTPIAVSPYQRIELGTRRVAVELGTEFLSAAAAPYGLANHRRGLSATGRVSMAWVPWDLVLDRAPAPGIDPVDRSLFQARGSVGIRYTTAEWMVDVRFFRHTREYFTQRLPFGYGSIAITRVLER